MIMCLHNKFEGKDKYSIEDLRGYRRLREYDKEIRVISKRKLSWMNPCLDSTNYVTFEYTVFDLSVTDEMRYDILLMI